MIVVTVWTTCLALESKAICDGHDVNTLMYVYTRIHIHSHDDNM